jgi:hypothetical protein
MSNEFYYIDENGKKSDAALHNAILDGVDDLPMRWESARQVLALTGNEKAVRQLYQIPDELRL